MGGVIEVGERDDLADTELPLSLCLWKWAFFVGRFAEIERGLEKGPRKRTLISLKINHSEVFKHVSIRRLTLEDRGEIFDRLVRFMVSYTPPYLRGSDTDPFRFAELLENSCAFIQGIKVVFVEFKDLFVAIDGLLPESMCSKMARFSAEADVISRI